MSDSWMIINKGSLQSDEWNSIEAVVQSCATAAAAGFSEGQFARSNEFNKLSISQATLHSSIDLLDLGRA